MFCEKPLAFTAAEAAAHGRTLADAAGVTHQVGLVLRRSPAYLWAQAPHRRPDAGRVMTVVFRDDQFIPIQGHYASTWRGDRRLVGAGTLLEHSIHDVDMLRYLVGEVRRVSAHTANFHGLDGIEDVATASLASSDGATGVLNSVWHDNLARPSLRRVEVFCERRHIVIDGDDWFGPVSWTDTDGTTGSLRGRGAQRRGRRRCATAPTTPTASSSAPCSRAAPPRPTCTPRSHAHRIVDAMYASAAADGAPRSDA